MRLAVVILASGCGRLDFDDAPRDAPADTLDAAPLLLADRGLVVRYFIDEAESGSAEPALRSATSEPFDLPIDYRDEQPTWVMSPGGRGLAFTAAELDANACADLGGATYGAFAGSTTGTLEVVASARECSTQGSRWLHMGAGQEWRFSLACLPGAVAFYINRDGGSDSAHGLWQRGLADPHVYTAVLDTSLPADDRMQLFVDGVRQAPTSGIAPAEGERIDLGAELERSLCVGNRKIGGRTAVGVLAYAAAYSAALTPDEIAANAARLAISNDR